MNIAQCDCFDHAIKIYTEYAKRKQLCLFEEETFSEVAYWITRRIPRSVRREGRLPVMSGYDFLAITLLYYFMTNKNVETDNLSKMVSYTRREDWTTLRSSLDSYFKPNEEELRTVAYSVWNAIPMTTLNLKLKKMNDYFLETLSPSDLSLIFEKACREGDFPVVKMLLIANNFPIPNEALHWAANGTNVDVVKALLEKGAKHYIKNAEGHTPLYIAVLNGNLEIVKVLYEKFISMNVKDNISSKQIGKKTVLHLTAENGHCQIVEYFIKKGVNVSAKTESGLTALHLAVMNNHSSVASCLIEKGADLDAKCNMNKTPLQYALESNQQSMVDFILKAKGINIEPEKEEDISSQLATSFITGLRIIGNRFVTNGVDVNSTDKNGCTPCHLAASSGYTTVCELLTTMGASWRKKDDLGWEPLHYGANKGRKEVVEYILIKILDVNCTTNNEETALHLAAKNGHHEVVKILLKAGIDSKKYDIYGYRAIHYAAMRGHLAVVEEMCDSGVEFGCWTSDGLLKEVAEQNEHDEVAAFLGEVGDEGDEEFVRLSL